MRKIPKQERSRLLVESIIDATAIVIAKHGLAAATTARIAEQAGISIGSLYQYFDSKEDLDLLEGVKDLIKDLHANGIQLIVASSASKVTIDRVFTRFGLHDYFTHIVSGEDFPKSKPHPAIFEHAASLSIAPKENCIVIEDSTNGVKAAKAAGILCIGYNSLHSKDQDLSEADTIINHFNELSFEKVADIDSKLSNN